jgi:hypothetical protein
MKQVPDWSARSPLAGVAFAQTMPTAPPMSNLVRLRPDLSNPEFTWPLLLVGLCGAAQWRCAKCDAPLERAAGILERKAPLSLQS